jgi:hypothetical protein
LIAWACPAFDLKFGIEKDDAPRRVGSRGGASLRLRALCAREEKNSGSDLLSHMETMQYHRL